MKGIKNFDTFTKIEHVNKGYSKDKKYYIETADGSRLLLRISDIAEFEHKKAEFDVITAVHKLGISMSQPIDFGICNDGKNVYMLLSWCVGEDAETILPNLSVEEQYSLGVNAGKILKKIHTVAVPQTIECRSAYFNRKADLIIQRYRECPVKIEGDSRLIDCIENNRYLPDGRPGCFQHGDYHAGNMIILNNSVSIIDFNRFGYGDPWEEFKSVWSAVISPRFAAGQVDGYFDNTPPLEFFELLRLYQAYGALSLIIWSISFGGEQIQIALERAKNVLEWFDNMKNPVPLWYTDGIKK